MHPAQLQWVGRIADLLADADACPGCESMVILEGDTVIGYYRIERHAAAVIGRRSNRPELESALGLRAFFLAIQHQGRGVGCHAVQALCDDLAQRHHDRHDLVLTVGVDNHAALGCYLRAGFRKTGTLYHGGHAAAQHLMRRRLNPIHTHR